MSASKLIGGTPEYFASHLWKAAQYRASQRKGPVRGLVRRASISGTTWPGEAMAIAKRPRIIHNQTGK